MASIGNTLFVLLLLALYSLLHGVLTSAVIHENNSKWLKGFTCFTYLVLLEIILTFGATYLVITLFGGLPYLLFTLTALVMIIPAIYLGRFIIYSVICPGGLFYFPVFNTDWITFGGKDRDEDS